MNSFIGDVPLCYTNSVAMVLKSYGYHFQPEYIEALMVMGNGASFVDKNTKHPLVFFDNGLPDLSISNSLTMLGFNYEEFYLTDIDENSIELSKKKLEQFLRRGSVIVGPLDMGHLNYNPNSINQSGVDHFVSVTNLENDYIYLHDPAGYPYIKMRFEEFVKAWRAEDVDYKRGSFSMWGNLYRTKTPTAKEIFHCVSIVMKTRYEQGDTKVIEYYANAIKTNGLNQQQQKIHHYFSFRLASARNLYMSEFLKEFDLPRAEIKEKLAISFGQAHLDSMKKEYTNLANTLMDIAKLDELFRTLCIQYKGD